MIHRMVGGGVLHTAVGGRRRRRLWARPPGTPLLLVKIACALVLAERVKGQAASQGRQGTEDVLLAGGESGWMGGCCIYADIKVVWGEHGERSASPIVYVCGA